MSIPKKHHYVSRCHQKEFLNPSLNKIYIYDKEFSNFYSKQSTKNLFSQDYLNSRTKEGYIDHQSLEFELKVIEDDFPKHLEVIKTFIQDQNEFESAYESLGWMMLLGILGEMRHPTFKQQIDDVMTNFESDVYNKISGMDKDVIKEMLKIEQHTPYNNIVGYMDIALKIFEKMEPLEYFIFKIDCDFEFILPDTSSFQRRGQLKQYKNPFINEIVQVGIPLTDKIFVLGTSKALRQNLSGIKWINDDDYEIVRTINKDLYDFSKKAVAGKNDETLRENIEQIKNCT